MSAPRRSLGLLLASGTCLSLASVANATILTWNNAAGGAASTSTNWSPAQIPTAADDLVFNTNASFAVTFNGTVPTSDTMIFKRGVVTLTMSAPHTTNGGFIVSDVSPDLGTATLTTGTWNVTGPILIADVSTITGTLNVNDDDADLIGSTAANDVRVGEEGTGFLNITGGGRMVVGDRFTIGDLATGVGTAVVSGSVLSFPNNVRSTLEALGTAQPHCIGFTGDGTLNVLAGGQAIFSGSLNVGHGNVSTGRVLVEGSSGISFSNLQVAGNLNIAANQSAALPGGDGEVRVGSQGTVTVGGATNIATDPDGEVVSRLIVEGGILTTHDLVLGTGGVLTHTSGTIAIDGGVFTIPATGYVLGSSLNPRLVLQNDATASLSSILEVGNIQAGTQSATIEVLTGADLVSSSSIELGKYSGDQASLLVRGTGSSAQMSSGSILIGTQGSGSLTVDTSGLIEVSNFTVASNPGSTGDALLTGTGSLVDADFARIGQSGNGTLVIEAGADMTSSGAAQIALNPGSTGSLTVRGVGSTLTTPFVVVGGSSVTDGGDGTLLITDGAVVDAATLASWPGTTTTIGANATLDGAFQANHRGSFVLSGGTITGFQLLNGVSGLGSLSGFGTVDSPLTAFASITATGTGLLFNKLLSATTTTMGGTRFTFGNGGGFTGSGTIAAPVTAQAGSIITATGPLTMGSSAFTTGFEGFGTLNVGPHEVTLLDSSATFSVNTNLGGGTLRSVNGFVVNNSPSLHTLSGFGTIITDFVGHNFGLISPGDASDATATLTISGELIQSGFTTRTNIDVQGTGAADFDRIVVANAANLSGVLAVTKPAAFTPPQGATFDILIAASINGTFTSLDAPGFTVQYLSDRVRLVFGSPLCDSVDFDGDGDTGTDADIEAFFACLGGSCCPTCGDPDFDNDGDTGTDADIEAFFTVLGGGPC
jgi:fibronectin-binding autotransporter adhesin